MTIVTCIREAWRSYEEGDGSGKSKDPGNWMLWDVGKGDSNLIFRALACAKLGEHW